MHSQLAELLTQVNSLPYGRNSNRADFTLVLAEKKGTCSTKHAYVKHIALQKNWPEVKLFIGVYLMSESNTPGVGKVLGKYGLNEIPEAHTYLKINGKVKDITGLNGSNESFMKTLQNEEEIQPQQIGVYKTQLHKAFIRSWADSVKCSAEELWVIREECISALTLGH